jgi:hypothetical protein
VVPSGLGSDAITVENDTVQPVAAELVIILAIKYSPLINRIGQDLWAWAWPKLRDRLDGAARDVEDQ